MKAHHSAQESTKSAATADSVHSRLRALRGDRSLRDFAAVLDVHYNTIAQYEKGRAPDIHFLLNVCERTGCSKEWLLLGKGHLDESTYIPGSPEMHISIQATKAGIKLCQAAGISPWTREFDVLVAHAASASLRLKNFESLPPEAIEDVVRASLGGILKKAA